MHKTMRFLYEVVFFIFSFFYLPVFIAKGKFGASWRERFGRVPREVSKTLSSERVLWVHAVSVGEVGLAIGFLDRLREALPEFRFVITTTTLAGHEVAQKIKKEEDVLLYFPVDFRSAIRRFIKSISPEVMVLFETEIWPNLIWELSARKIPVFILNGRISDRAFQQYRKIRVFLKRVLGHLSLIAAQDERMRGRFIALGADPEKVTVTGNVKFDWKPVQGAAPAEAQRLQRFCKKASEFLCVAGSTHEGEEEVFFSIHRKLQNSCPGFRLLIAPRHLNRMAAIETSALKYGLSARRIGLEDRGFEKAIHEGEILLLDQMGVLPFLYETADLVFVGGSLVPVGGHNLVEPAYFERPILFGPFMNNFLEMAEEFKKNEAACPVKDAGDLEKNILDLFSTPARRQSLGKAAKRLVLHHQGAQQRNIELLVETLGRTVERKLVTA